MRARSRGFGRIGLLACGSRLKRLAGRFSAAMSLINWLRRSSSSSDKGVLAAAVEAVQPIQEQTNLQARGCKRKSSERHANDEATRTAIGKYAQLHGSTRAVEKFSASLGYNLSEATVRLCTWKKIIPVISKHLCTIVSPFLINRYNKNVIMEIFKKSLKFQSANITRFTVCVCLCHMALL